MNPQSKFSQLATREDLGKKIIERINHEIKRRARTKDFSLSEVVTLQKKLLFIDGF
jgi:hypothetical protein